MGGASVFPGGAVSESDHDPRWERVSALTPEQAAASLGLEDGSLALGAYVAALREAFEEVGYPPTREAVPDRSVADDPAGFLATCLDRGATLRSDELVPGGRWVTPLGSPVRFDARFFLTVVPDGWEPSPDPEEVAGCEWVTPGEALAGLAAGNRLMAPPTIEMLQRLDRYTSTGDALSGFLARGLKGAGNVLSLQVSPLVRVILAPNAGVMTGPGTNTYVVGSGPFLVIDPAVDDDEYFDALLEACERDVDQILITHRHSDHVGGVARLVEATSARVRAWGSGEVGGTPVEPLEPDELIEVPGVTLRSLHTPGHASDHVCFYMEGAASLFAGDTILGEGTAVIAPPDGDMKDYLDTLRRLGDLYIDRIFPGHWRPLDGGAEVIRGYLEHRKAREAKILNAVPVDGAGLDAIVAAAYADTPEHLHPVARFSAVAHLEMLEQAGAVRRSGDAWLRLAKEDV